MLEIKYFPHESTISDEMKRYCKGLGFGSIPPEGILCFKTSCVYTYIACSLHDQKGRGRIYARGSSPFRAIKSTEQETWDVPPRPLLWSSASKVHVKNATEDETYPRLLSLTRGPDGHHHTIVECINSQGETTKFQRGKLRTKEDRTIFNEVKDIDKADHVWIKICHLQGRNACGDFIRDQLIPMLGPKPARYPEYNVGRGV